MLPDFIGQELSEIKDAGLYRYLHHVEGPQGPRVRMDGREVILLCSNNYLGLANHPEVKRAAIEAIERYGLGAGASRLISGSMEPHKELEERLAKFKGTEAALVFNSGYHANIGIISSLVGRGDVIFADKLNHASIVDACILSRAEVKRYPHCDLNGLERFLKNALRTTYHASRKLIITDGVFSMDGDIAPLRELSELAERYGCMLMVDDAHAVGVLGANGRGTLEYLGIENPNIVQMGTLGKALGSFGAYVVGSKKLIDYLINKARSFIYTTALPPAVCAATIRVLEVIEREPSLRKGLWDRVEYLRKGLKASGLNTLMSETHIIPIFIGDADRTMEVSRRLLERGVFIQGIRPPTVQEGMSRLRVTLMANHPWDDLEYAIEAIKEVMK